jgi:hypothetical protein
MRPLLLSLLIVQTVAAASLDSAWIEYRFQNWHRAEDLFGRVLRDREAGEDQKLTARMGQALIAQYRMPGARPDKAATLYRGLLAELGGTHRLVPRLRLFLARACAQMRPADTAQAYAQFDSVIACADPLIAGEAVVDRARLMVSTPTAGAIAATRAFLERMLAEGRGAPAAGAMHGLAGGLAMVGGDYRAARDHIVRQLDAGGYTQVAKAMLLIQAARLSEVALRDTATALVYYRRFVDEVPFDTRGYFCSLKVRELERAQP